MPFSFQPTNMSHVLQKGFITLASRRNNNDMKQKAEDVLIASSFNVDLTQCPKKLRLAVGLNAAAVSSKALETALAMYNKERGDILYLFTVDEGKDNKWGTVKQVQDNANLRCSHLEIEPIWQVKTLHEGEKAVDILLNLAERYLVDFMFVGSMGSNSDGQGIHVLGTTSEFSLRNSLVSVVVVKNTAYEFKVESLEEDGGLTYFIATDHSLAAQAAFAWLVMLVVKQGRDKLYVAYTSDIAASTTLLEPYKSVMRLRGIDGDCIFDSSDGAEKPSTRIMQLAKKYNSDFVVTGVSGFSGDKKLGSVSEDIVTNSRSSVVVVKEPTEVADRRRIRVTVGAA